MSLTVKRKRGRPRRDEPREINDFDLALIQEFRKRPCFYDRNHQQYRNREYLEPQWAQMANNLGYNVAMVKDRMLQLRNRYNLEKRRVENLQEQYNDPNITSQWALYDHLTFLGEHIKSRRPAPQFNLSLKPKRPGTNSSESEAADDDGDESQQLYRTKATAYAQLQLQLQRQQQQMQPPSSSPHLLRRLPYNTRTNSSITNHFSVSKVNSATKSLPQNNMEFSDSTELANGADGIEKFKAFGHFLASSLIEMNECDALRLVEKFTVDLVKALIAQQKTCYDNDACTTNDSCNIKTVYS